MQQHDDNRLSCGQQTRDQFVLSSYKIEVVAVAKMGKRPDFAESMLVVTDDHDPVIGLAEHIHRLSHALFVQRRVGRNYFVFFPNWFALGNTTALGIEHLDFIPDLVLDSFQNTDRVLGSSAVSAEMRLCRIGSDDGNALELREIQRQQTVFILQQRNGFMRGLKSKVCIGLRACTLNGLLRIDKRMIKKS